MITRSGRAAVRPEPAPTIDISDDDQAPTESKIQKAPSLESEKEKENFTAPEHQPELKTGQKDTSLSSKRKRTRKRKAQNITNILTLSPPTSTDTNSKISAADSSTFVVSDIARHHPHHDILVNMNNDERTVGSQVTDGSLDFDKALQKALNSPSKVKNSQNGNSMTVATLAAPKIRKRQPFSMKNTKENHKRHGVILLESQEKHYQKIMKKSKIYKSAREFNSFKFSFNQRGSGGDRSSGSSSGTVTESDNLRRFKENVVKRFGR